MPGAATPRLGLVKPLGADPVQQLRLSLGTTQDMLEANGAIDGQGAFASRPVSTPATPGVRGRYYFSTDTGAFDRDTGTAWVTINAITSTVDVETLIWTGGL